MTTYHEMDGALYELVPSRFYGSCAGCVFEKRDDQCGRVTEEVECSDSGGVWKLVGTQEDHQRHRACSHCLHAGKTFAEAPCNQCRGSVEVPVGYAPKWEPRSVLAAKPAGPVTVQLVNARNALPPWSPADAHKPATVVEPMLDISKYLNDAPPVRGPEAVAAVLEAMAISQATGQYDAAVKESNPKTAIGDKKVPLALLSPIAEAHWSLAQFAGMCKYQAWNWRIAGVRASTYHSAMKRHLAAWQSGEQLDPTDGTHHLGNIMACAAILLDAEAAGKLTDDRPPSVDVRPTYAFVEAQMAVLKEKYAHIEQKPFTIADTESPTKS